MLYKKFHAYAPSLLVEQTYFDPAYGRKKLYAVIWQQKVGQKS